MSAVTAPKDHHKGKLLPARVSLTMYGRLSRLARREGRSLAALVVTLIREALAARRARA